MAGDSAISAISLTANSFSKKTGDVDVLSSTAAATIDLSDQDGSKVVIHLVRDASATNPTIVVEDGGEFSAGTVGNITQATTASGEYYLVAESSRVKDSSGKINITKSTTDTAVVTAAAIVVP